MQDRAEVDIYLEPPLRESEETGAHDFIGKVARVLEKAQFRVTYRDIGGSVRAPDALSLSHMSPAPTTRGLIFRRCYHYPFWQIEARPERWSWDVALGEFDPALIDPFKAQRFLPFLAEAPVWQCTRANAQRQANLCSPAGPLVAAAILPILQPHRDAGAYTCPVHLPHCGRAASKRDL